MQPRALCRVAAALALLAACGRGTPVARIHASGGEVEVTLEVAATPEAQQRGLMYRTSLTDDHYTFHENTRQIIGAKNRKTYSIGEKVRVLVDRIDRMQRKIQFAVVREKPAKKKKQNQKA